MKKAIIIVLLIAQTNSMSFYDVFAPVEDSLGRLVSDVVSDIKDTIDCTILAVEHVFSLGGMFGGSSEYDEKCRGQKEESDSQVSQPDSSTDYDTREIVDEYPPEKTTKKEITQEVEESMSNASQQIQNILDHSNAHVAIENVKNSIKNETDRLLQISTLLRKEIEKLPDDVKKKLKFNYDQPSIDDLFNQVKSLYNLEQKDKSSAEANEVRRLFDKVLNIFLDNSSDGYLSDEDEVKLILTDLGKLSNDSLTDVGNKVSLWTNEEKQEITDIKHVVIINTNVTPSGIENKGDKNKTNKNVLLTEKLDEIDTQKERMVDFSNSLKDLTKIIISKSSVISSPHKFNFPYATNSTSENKTAIKKVLTEKESFSSPENIYVSTEPSTNTNNNITGSSLVSNDLLQNYDPTIFSSATKDLSKSTKTYSVSSGSSGEALSRKIDNPSEVKKNLTNIILTELLEKPSTKVNISRSPPNTAQKTTFNKTSATKLQLSTITSISKVTLQTTQMNSITTVQTLQSNVKKINTTVPLPEPNAQQQQEASKESSLLSQIGAQLTTASPIVIGYQQSSLIEQIPTELPKSFKELAQMIMEKDGSEDYQDSKDYTYSKSTSDYLEKGSLLNELFGGQTKDDQQEAVASAKNLIEESNKNSAFMDNFFKHTDSSAPSVFDDPNYFDF